MSYRIFTNGPSNSFPDTHPFLAGATLEGDIAVYIGTQAGAAFNQTLAPVGASVIELGNECLGVHVDATRTDVLGFARFRLGRAAPSNLIELVKLPATAETALAAVKQMFVDAGFKVALCNDFPGRIVNRLLRPYYNAALRRLDEGLASASDLDTTLRLGLGYPEGPIELLQRTGLAQHFDVTQDLYVWTGDAAYAPARRARIAKLVESSDDASTPHP